MTNSRRQSRLLVVPLASIALLVVGSATPASSAPAPIKCGTVITTSTTLLADVGPCSSGGLVIGADGITLNLNGHRVSGKANRTGDGVGILLSGRTGVTVTGGRVTDFDAGVAIVGGSANTVQSLLVKDNIGTAKRGDFGDGIAISGSSDNIIQDNDVIHNGPYDGIGLLGISTGNLIDGNVVSENNVPRTGEDGIRIEGPGASSNTVTGNTVTGSTLDGIAVFRGQNNGNTVSGNTVSANGFGFLGARPGDGIRTFPDNSQTMIQSNQVHDNAGHGIVISAGSLNNQILTNTSTGNAREATTGPRFDLADFNLAPPCDNNIWSANVYGTANQPCTTL